ncbi:uncharacterized protein UDID_06576 [Ustilago sp. UG-2017a]|nr:uncharacterized protein UDID_06576 [Ustilago sp. UG-2017a]
MSLSDLFNISQTVRRDKAREQDLLPVPTSSRAASARLCNICYAQPATYSCPRCNVPFCSLICFRRREHQDCSAVFSSSAISLAVGSPELLAEDGDRQKVVSILDRLEKDARATRQRQEDAQEEEESNDDEDIDQAAGLRANITADQIKSASSEALLAMLTPKEKQKFLEAIKDPQTASQLMQRLERKADRLAPVETSATKQGVLIAAQSPPDRAPTQPAPKRAWQSTPWFETSDACPDFSSRDPDEIFAFSASLEKILRGQSAASTRSGGPAPVNLVYNLCAVLMAYAYTLRHLDIASLSGLTKPLASSKPASALLSASAPTPDSTRLVQSLLESLQENNDDDEPPPLEPDDPVDEPASLPASSHVDLVPVSASKTRVDADASLATTALEKLVHLVPFLPSQPIQRKENSQHVPAGRDPSRLALTSLDDASMWLLSRLSLNAEVGPGGADAINLQLLQDLSQLLAREQLLPTFAHQDDVEPRFLIVAKLCSLPSQQAFIAAQMPSLTNAIADLHFFLEDLAAHASSRDPLLTWSSKSLRLAQRKLCFYFCSSILSDQAATTRTSSNIREETLVHEERLRRRIEVKDQADKLASAISKLQ